MARAALSVITSALNPLSTMQTWGPESLICMVTKICFLKYSKGIVTGAFSPVRKASRAFEGAALPPPNDKSAIPPRIAGHRIHSLRSIFRSNSFAVHRPARQPKSRSPGCTQENHFGPIGSDGPEQEGSTSGLTWEPDKGDATAAQAARSAARDQFLRVPSLGLLSHWRLRMQFRSQALSLLLPLVLAAVVLGGTASPSAAQQASGAAAG